jgi:hypothetical protein
VSLPVPGYAFWIGDEEHVFSASLSNPNGQADQYPANDSFTTSFAMPDLINIPIVMVLKTNKQAYRYSLVVRDIEGNIILSREGLENTTIYKDTLDLPLGCYSIELTDSEDMGLSYWAYPEQGSGYFRLLDLDSNIIKSFNSEFGRTIFYTYNVSEGFYIDEPGFDQIVRIFPNPAHGIVNVDITGLQGKVKTSIYNLQGKLILSEDREAGLQVYDLSRYPAGLYLVEIQSKGFCFREKVVLL